MASASEAEAAAAARLRGCAARGHFATLHSMPAHLRMTSKWSASWMIHLMKVERPKVTWHPSESTCLVIQKQPQVCCIQAFKKQLRKFFRAFGLL